VQEAGSPKSRKTFWGNRINKLPYGILYFIENEKIIILAIMHLKKKTGYWKDRLE